MAEITPIQFYRGTAAAWTSANPTLAAGKPGFETDTGKLKIGDGTTAWNSLPYINGSSTNGLTTTSGTTKLGGALTEDTTITGANKDLIIGTNASPLSGIDIQVEGDIVNGTYSQITSMSGDDNNVYSQLYAQSTTDSDLDQSYIQLYSQIGVARSKVQSDSGILSGGAVNIEATSLLDDTVTLRLLTSSDIPRAEIDGGNLVMNSNKITGLGAATANGDAVRYEQVVPAQRSGTVIAFDAPATYGYTAAETGNITLNATGLVEGTTQILIHNHSVEPTFASEFKVVNGEYALSTTNYIMLVAVKSNLILVSITQEL